jgi:hypothetical protein
MTTTVINGFYAVYLSTKIGQGFAMLLLRNGQIVGADASGVLLDGKYIESETNGYIAKVTVNTPANIQLMQGGFAGPQGESYDLDIPLPNDFLLRDFVRIETPRGPINAKFVKVRSLDE